MGEICRPEAEYDRESRMGHAKPDELKDLQTVLSEVRKLPNIKETAKNVFYVKRVPFLHFHTKDGRRWADCKDGKDWGKEMEVPFNAETAAKLYFVKEVKRRFARSFAENQ